ncbi:MAG TPA: 23S rRNA (pseudouridine(1915)-N(3))-methyltransferase RlmH [Porphyromonadaceae bacterium]|nr:23S rRNA (pseudouridine(1915)-N(3))-methyltransferase RlmH [Porphyromonadaceae bacterium]
MKIILLMVGKTSMKYVEEGFDLYVKRIMHYLPFEVEIIPDIRNSKNLTTEQIKQQEGESILKRIHLNDEVILLDEHGEMYSSLEFSSFLEKRVQKGVKRLVFIIGGAYGFSPEIYASAHGKISLSKMTFSHQMVRLIFAEQLYRAFSILHNEPYHHE